MEPATRAGAELAGAVLGAGLLIAPPVVASVAGTLAPAAWLIHLGAGAVFSAVLAVLACTATGAGSIADVTGTVLGGWARRTVLWAYLGGFTVGQAAIALAAGGLIAAALGVPGHSGGASGLALAILAAATAGAVAGVGLGHRARRWRLVITGLLALVGCARPELFGAAALLSSSSHPRLAAAVFLLFFAGVGWEASARLAPGTGAPLRTVAVGALLVTAVYMSLALLLSVRGPGASATGPVIRAAAFAGGLVLMSYCLTNIIGAARFVVALGGPDRPWVRLAVGGTSMLTVALAFRVGWGVAALLTVPCLAAWIGYVLATFAAVRNGGARIQLVGVSLLFGFTIMLLAAAWPQE
jgi:amino acid efflux transporter